MAIWQSLRIFTCIKPCSGKEMAFLLPFISIKWDTETKGGIHLAVAASELLFSSNPFLCVLSGVSEWVRTAEFLQNDSCHPNRSDNWDELQQALKWFVLADRGSGWWNRAKRVFCALSSASPLPEKLHRNPFSFLAPILSVRSGARCWLYRSGTAWCQCKTSPTRLPDTFADKFQRSALIWKTLKQNASQKGKAPKPGSSFGSSYEKNK